METLKPNTPSKPHHPRYTCCRYWLWFKILFRGENALPGNAGTDDNMIIHTMCTEEMPRNVLFLHAATLNKAFGRGIYSLLTPTLPIFLSPSKQTTNVVRLNAKQYQKVALYPSKRASGLCLSSELERAVTLSAMTALVASPILLPTCAIVLNTPPASA